MVILPRRYSFCRIDQNLPMIFALTPSWLCAAVRLPSLVEFLIMDASSAYQNTGISFFLTTFNNMSISDSEIELVRKIAPDILLLDISHADQ